MGTSKAERIRQMYEAGYSVSEISKSLGIRYQHAYNVVTAHLRKKEIEVMKMADEAVQQAAYAKEYVTTKEETGRDTLRATIRRIFGY